ncbi:sensor histidine kinase [Actinophytocola sp.]|uniref:sensor histidine kinase n=1 Tax=Actinophytocola sp. TaxID=1872138 RepID=UPI002ED329D4
MIPQFVHSTRFRLTVLYSTLLFALTAIALAVIYFAVIAATDPKPITQQYEAQLVKLKADGSEIPLGTMTVAEVDDIESAANLQTLQNLRTYSAAVLGGMFLASLGIGWVLSGRALRPALEIAHTAREIQATDLSRRINLDGTKGELRDLADTIDAMLDRLDDAFQAQRQLIDDASHELRSPLAIIRAHLDAALTAPDASPTERERAVEVIDRATNRMSRLVEDLLATARRSADALADTDTDLSTIANEASEEFTVLAASRGVRLTTTLTPDLVLIGDHDALRRAVGNLLSNAVRLTDSTITVATGRHDGWLWLTIADDGPGIPDEDQPRIFDRFWRRAQSPALDDRHTGLGLAIVRQIVESHDGRITLFSQAEQGSTFVLWFPARDRPYGAPPPEVPSILPTPAEI